MPMLEDEMTRTFFRASVVITMGSGALTLFWEERWLNGQGIQEIAPDFVATVTVRRQRR
jgi:hypothetical protein